MNEEEQVKKQLRKNMLLNLIAFVIIFYILGMVIYGQFRNTLYQSADAELEKVVSQNNNFEKQSVFNKRIVNPNLMEEDKPKNPRLIFIERDEEGEIKSNSERNNALNTLFQSTPFNKEQINSIYEIKIDHQYYYHGINYLSEDGDYIQVLINVDAEKAMLERFTAMLVIAITISIFMILVASYLLARRTLQPIIESWKKQNQFIQDASHELRTPLAIIQAKQESLLEKPEEKIIDNAEEISTTLNETKRLTKLIKELMELARNKEKQESLKKETFFLDEEIKSIVGLYQDVAKAEGKELTLKLEYQEELLADPNKIKELLIILLDNSLKYTEEADQIEVKTYKKENKCVLEVVDTGIGIGKEAQAHIFERFYREEKSRDRQKGGMGLGLSIAYQIVKLHKGTIKLDKTREKGTRMIVKIPIK